MIAQKYIGANIKNMRKSMGLTQDDLAAYLDIKRESVSYYENGSGNIPINTLSRLADLFGIELHELMEENLACNAIDAAFAFRVENFTAEDLKTVANFKKVAKNYIKLVDIEKKHGCEL